MIKDQVTIKIKRQDNPNLKPRWETFVLKYRPSMNIITCLMDIRKNPRTIDGIKTTPVKWEQNCLEEVCGSCSMVINGRVRQACSALVDELEDPITIEPMSKFPMVCDLVVDRTRMFDALKAAKAWIPIDGTHNIGPGPRIYPGEQQDMYALSKCMTCGCCLEACPQINERSPFVGAAVISQVKLFNENPTGHANADERLDAMMVTGGAQDCGNAQNCVQACPQKIPLTTSIAEINKQITLKLFGLFKK